MPKEDFTHTIKIHTQSMTIIPLLADTLFLSKDLLCKYILFNHNSVLNSFGAL